MDKLNIIFMLSLPVVFILHDFEEILGMENFINKGLPKLQMRLPKIAALLLPFAHKVVMR
ncbi:MAG: hypothetical protein PHR20_02850 [Bacteroidales bacterium]|nr:hypothetical protein [Bacteroidales bacterium]